MVGTWIFNLLLGLFGFFIVFLLSFSGNSMMTAIVRALITFVSFFIIGYIFRWMFSYIKAEQIENLKSTNAQAGPFPLKEKNMEIQQLIGNLSEEESRKVAEYIRSILREDNGTED